MACTAHLDQKTWNDFLAKINYTDAVRTKNNVIVKNIKTRMENQNLLPLKVMVQTAYWRDISGNGGVGGMSISGAIAGSTGSCYQCCGLL